MLGLLDDETKWMISAWFMFGMFILVVIMYARSTRELQRMQQKQQQDREMADCEAIASVTGLDGAEDVSVSGQSKFEHPPEQENPPA